MKTNKIFFISFLLYSYFSYSANRAKESYPYLSCYGEREALEIVCKDTSSARFPFLADILDLYYDYYLTMPNTIKKLEEFTDIIHDAYPEELYYYNLLKQETFPTLREYKMQLFFKETECDLQLWLKENNDSVMLYNVDGKPCCSLNQIPYQEERLATISHRVYAPPKAFSNENKITLLKERSSKLFLNKMRSIYKRYKINRERVVLVDYTIKGGLINYCKKEKIENNGLYMQEIESVLKEFCKRNNIHRLILYIYCQ